MVGCGAGGQGISFTSDTLAPSWEWEYVGICVGNPILDCGTLLNLWLHMVVILKLKNPTDRLVLRVGKCRKNLCPGALKHWKKNPGNNSIKWTRSHNSEKLNWNPEDLIRFENRVYENNLADEEFGHERAMRFFFFPFCTYGWFICRREMKEQ